MSELFAVHHRIYGKCLIFIKIFFPWNGLYLLIYLIGILGCEVLDGFQDADGGSQAKIGLVHHLFVSGE